MYHFLEKNEYFTALDIPEIEYALQGGRHMGLKHMQDACVLHKLLNLSPGNVAEVGGGISRTLPFLQAQGWCCWNIEPFEGSGNGPRTPHSIPGVTHINAYLGSFSNLLADAQFDLVYSISVIEHVPTQDLPAFFRDMFRILKPGGQAWHAIDAYLRDEDDPTVTQRIEAVYNAALKAGFTPVFEEALPESKFHCAYATNPDLVIRQWNQSVPALRAKRSVSQSVSLLLGLNR